jgi:hypothetical protein
MYFICLDAQRSSYTTLIGFYGNYILCGAVVHHLVLFVSLKLYDWGVNGDVDKELRDKKQYEIHPLERQQLNPVFCKAKDV